MANEVAEAPVEDLRATLERAVEAHETRPAGEDGPLELPAAPSRSAEGTEGIREQKPGLEAKSPPVEPGDTRPKPLEPTVSDSDKSKLAPQEQKPVETPVLDGEDKAPQAWRGPLKEKWSKVDPEIRQEITRRERETGRILQEASNHRKFTEGFQEVLQPYLPRLQSANVHPLKAVQSLLAADAALATAPMAKRAELMATMIKDYGIDFQMLDAALAGKNPSETSPTAIIDARVQAGVEAALAPFRQFMGNQQQREQAQVQATQQQVQTEVNAMAADATKYPEFWNVQQDMADITDSYYRRGIYLSADEAYSRAVRMNPEAFGREQARTQRVGAVKVNQNAQRALGASLSVSGTPIPTMTEVDPSDLRGTIEAAWNAHAGR